MENRLVITSLCAAALVYACGPWIHSQSGAQAPLAVALASSSKQPRSQSKRTAGSVVATTLDVVPIGGRVALALRVTNNTPKTVELRFPNGRTHDFAILDSHGKTVWRWSAGRLFTQTMQSKAVKSRDTMTMEDSWDASGAHGAYTAVALLATDTHPVERRVDFMLP
ncbi:MAG: BsuPI-related putative proteinase inhibitor [Gemmatimonadaceae bacterium]